MQEKRLLPLTKTLQGVVADTNAVHEDNNPVTQTQGEITKGNYILDGTKYR